MRAVLDTSVVLAADVDPLPGELAGTAATLAELHFGVLVTDDPVVRTERLRRLSVLQRQFAALPVDDAVAASYGRVAAASGRRPRARVMDLLIAATAHAHGAPPVHAQRPRPRRRSSTWSRWSRSEARP